MIPHKVFNWAEEVKTILQECGVNGVWLTQNVGNRHRFLSEIYQRLFDIAVNNCLAENMNSVLYQRYASYKSTFNFEPYLKNTLNKKYRIALSKLRLCANNLRVNSGIRQHLQIGQRLCNLCETGNIEDEHHFVLKYTFYSELREQLLPEYIKHDSIYYFNRLMSSTENADLMYRLGKFIYLSMEKRKMHYLNIV